MSQSLAAVLFVEVDGQYGQVGEVVDLGVVDFFANKAIFGAEVIDQRKRIYQKGGVKFRGSLAALALLVEQTGVDVKTDKKARRNFRLLYPNGEIHTMECIAIVKKRRQKRILEIQLLICKKPVVESAQAA